MAPSEINELAAKIAKLIADDVAMKLSAKEISPVLNEEETLALTKARSIQALNRWQRKYGDCRCGNGRYSRAKVLRALERESKSKGSRSGQHLTREKKA